MNIPTIPIDMFWGGWGEEIKRLLKKKKKVMKGIMNHIYKNMPVQDKQHNGKKKEIRNIKKKVSHFPFIITFVI